MIYIYLFLAIVALLWSGGALAASLTNLSKRLRISAFLVSFLLMAAATSMPELFVGIMSGLGGEGSLAFGTIIGSNIADIALVLGVLLIINGSITVKGAINRRESIWVAILAMFPVLLALDGTLSRIDGVILVLGFILYAWQLVKNSHFFQKVNNIKANPKFWQDLVKFIGAIVVLIIASRYTVIYAEKIASDINIPIILIGIFLVALGTSLPELVFAIRSSQSGNSRLSLGDIVGSIVFNATIILGISALVSPIHLGAISEYYISAVALLILVTYFVYANYQNRVLNRNWGYALVAFYFVFLIVELV